MTGTEPPALLGVDTGGTFTDFVLLAGGQLRIHKVLSTPDDPSRAIAAGIREMGLEEAVSSGRLRLIHGSTVATNAALERKGVPTAYVANRGLADVLSLGRQNRAELYNLMPLSGPPPVPPERCLEVDCRLAADGGEVRPLSDEAITGVRRALESLDVEAVAINLLFSYVDEGQEKALAEALEDRWFVSRSSDVLPEAGEYERGIATWLNAWLGPRVRDYLRRLESTLAGCPVSMMQSSGGTIALGQAASRAVNLLLSGPAGGLAAARYLAGRLEEPRLLTFDMGGTSTDVALVAGDVRLTSEGRIGPWPVAVPMVDMHTIGAGGGSLAWVDEGGALQVGPASAGASPGPACYGQGGDRPTVTDANLLLGRLRPEAFLGGGMQLDEEAARTAFQPLADSLSRSLEDAAQGVVDVANERMSRALRTISLERGEDPRRFRLCCFGGAGGLHVCALARSLGMTKALVPRNAGVLSAFGMLVAPPERQLSRTLLSPLEKAWPEDLEPRFQALEKAGREALAADGVEGALEVAWTIDMRYEGQTFTLNLPWEGGHDLGARFHRAHEERFHHRLARGVELVTLRVAVRGEGARPVMPTARPTRENGPDAIRLPGIDQPVTLVDREALGPGVTLEGPVLVTEQVATTWVAPGWRLWVHPEGHLFLDYQP